MKDRKGNDFKEWAVEQTFPTTLKIPGFVEKQVVIRDPAPGSVKVETASFNSFSVTRLNFNLDQETLCHYAIAGMTMGLYFNLHGSCSFDYEGKKYTIASGQQTIFFASSFDERLILHPENGCFEALEINFPVSYYTSLLSGHTMLQDNFINPIISGKHKFLQLGVLPMTMPVRWIINTIRQSTRTGVLKRLFLESKILELLMLQVEQAEKLGTPDNAVFPKSANIERLHEAKLIIDRSLDGPPTIRTLAKMVGINEFNLKKGFKETFGITIYSYANKLKMEQARQMLLDGEKSITQVSAIAGYRNPQHFTAAFKKHFGMVPSKVKAIFLVFSPVIERLSLWEELIPVLCL